MTDSPSRAAVLVPIYSRADGIWVVLTQRAEDLRHHQGQVAFPGGRFDPHSDDSLLATALREAAEEIAIRGEDIEILGVLPDVRTLSSGFTISPFVGRVPEHYPFRPDPREVAEVFAMPLAVHGKPAYRALHRWRYGGVTHEVPAILYQGHLVWGVTLRILDLLVVFPLLRALCD